MTLASTNLFSIIGNNSFIIASVHSPPVAVETAYSACYALNPARHRQERELKALIDTCSRWFAQGNLRRGDESLNTLIENFPTGRLNEASRNILRHCADRLAEAGDTRIEYTLLALHTIRSLQN